MENLNKNNFLSSGLRNKLWKKNVEGKSLKNMGTKCTCVFLPISFSGWKSMNNHLNCVHINDNVQFWISGSKYKFCMWNSI
jgi:hypothetical protein